MICHRPLDNLGRPVWESSTNVAELQHAVGLVKQTRQRTSQETAQWTFVGSSPFTGKTILTEVSEHFLKEGDGGLYPTVKTELQHAYC